MLNISVDAIQITLSHEQHEFLEFALKHSRTVIDKWYPTTQHTYDEDSGVHTDHGSNDLETLWAHNFFRSGLNEAHNAFHKVKRLDDINSSESVATIIFPAFCRDFIVALIYGTALLQNELPESKPKSRKFISDLTELFYR